MWLGGALGADAARKLAAERDTFGSEDEQTWDETRRSRPGGSGSEHGVRGAKFWEENARRMARENAKWDSAFDKFQEVSVRIRVSLACCKWALGFGEVGCFCGCVGFALRPRLMRMTCCRFCIRAAALSKLTNHSAGRSWRGYGSRRRERGWDEKAWESEHVRRNLFPFLTVLRAIVTFAFSRCIHMGCFRLVCRSEVRQLAI